MSKEAPTRVVLADDHEVVRQGMKRLLNRVPEIQVVGEASNGVEALKFVEELRPDVLLLDIEMPLMDGIEVARQLRKKHVDVRILILSAYDDREYIRALLEIGVSGYLIKGEAPGKIVEAVQNAAGGSQSFVSNQVQKKLDTLHPGGAKNNLISQRGLQILHLLAAQAHNKIIAERLGLSEADLNREIQVILEQLHVSTWQEAVEVARRRGWF